MGEKEVEQTLATKALRWEDILTVLIRVRMPL